MKYSLWVKRFFILIVLSWGLIAAFNYIIDPYGFFRVVNVKGFNQQKEGVRTHIRYVKAVEISLRKPKTIIMGSSRVHDSMDPSYAKLESYQPVYNYGIDMARIKEIKYYLQHAIKNAEIKNLFIGLDYFMFNKYERLNFTFDKDLVNEEVSWIDVYFRSLLTFSAIKSSWLTLKESKHYPSRNEFLSNGYRPAKNVFFRLKSYEKLHNSTNWIFLSSKNKQTLYYAKMDTDEEGFNDLKEILEICSRESINIKLYISPAHANLDGEGVLAAGLYENLEEWKRRVSLIAWEKSVLLYDFSGYNDITTEPVITPMKNCWDSSHFTEDIGNEIWDVILGNSKSPLAFGFILNPENIETHLDINREAMKVYHEQNKDTLETLHRMYKKALAGEKQNTESLQGMF